MTRRDKINYYLDIAETVLTRGTCMRRLYGAIIVKNDQIISTGYVGAPRGRANCTDLGYCTRDRLQIPRGQRYELCRSVHAEANAIIHAARADMIGATMYLVGRECATGEYVRNANSCCHVQTHDHQRWGRYGNRPGRPRNIFRVISVKDEWIEKDESLEGSFGY